MNDSPSKAPVYVSKAYRDNYSSIFSKPKREKKSDGDKQPTKDSKAS